MQVPDNWIKTRADKKALEEGCYFDLAAGERVVKFLESYITLSTTGKPLRLYPFQTDFIIPLFSWKRADGRRRFTRCLLTTGKKSFGKTVLSAALSLYLLMADNVNSPLVVLGAVNQEQAAEMFKEVRFMADANEFLKNRIDMTASTYRAKYPKKNGELRAISCDSPSKGGWNCSAVILDEVCHYPRPTATNPGLYEMLKGSMKAREQPLMICCSNAGFDKGRQYYRDIYKPAKDVATNQSDDTAILPVIFEVSEETNWKDRSKIHLANPGLACGLLSQEAFDDEYKDALRNKSGEIWYRRYVLNQWTNAEHSWLDLDLWDECKGTFPDLYAADFYAGIDCSHTTDWTSICGCWPIGDKYFVRSWNFVPQAAIEKRNKQNLKDYAEFADNGDLILVPGNCIDYEQIHQAIRDIPGNCKGLIFDRWNSLATSQQLEKEGYPVFNFPQFHTHFNEPMKMLERLVIDKKLVHTGSLAERWSINNTSIDVNDRGLCKPTKSNEAYKIDFSVSLLMALSQAMLHAAKEPLPSGYEGGGITFC